MLPVWPSAAFWKAARGGMYLPSFREFGCFAAIRQETHITHGEINTDGTQIPRVLPRFRLPAITQVVSAGHEYGVIRKDLNPNSILP